MYGMYVYILHSCMCVLHMCVWIGVVLGPGTCGMERFEGPLRTTYDKLYSVCIHDIHVCTSRVKYQYQYVYINVVQVCTNRGT